MTKYTDEELERALGDPVDRHVSIEDIDAKLTVMSEDLAIVAEHLKVTKIAVCIIAAAAVYLCFRV